MNSVNTYPNNASDDFARKNINGANLSGRDLRNCNFTNVTANGADFSRAMLNGANFYGAEMRGVDLSKAILCGADLSESNLSGADLQRSDLSGAILYRANLSNADLTDIDLDGATVQDAKFINCQGLNQEMANVLKSRGEIVENTISSNPEKQERDTKWWIQYVIVPLIAALISSGVVMY
ncbi:MAG: pentapeptide repeat-containing protein, partial [Sphaerospermopsis sp. SIO1G2]|nr:pentapeptide repeat-containing protein [Sphaerospermopsis sp. SIO1G2]